MTSGLYAAIAVLGALTERAATDRGRHIEISMFDAAIEMMGYPLTWTRYAGTDQQPVGMGSPAVAPYGAYPTADGRVAVLGTTNDAEWRRLATLMLGREDLAADPRYARNDDRVSRRGELDAILVQWCASRTLGEVQDAADAAGIGNAVYRTPTEVLTHPHLAARNRWREVEIPNGSVAATRAAPDLRRAAAADGGGSRTRRAHRGGARGAGHRPGFGGAVTGSMRT